MAEPKGQDPKGQAPKGQAPKKQGAKRQAPRLARSLSPAGPWLEGDCQWEGLEAGSDTLVRPGAADCEVIGCRLRGVRFTGTEVHRLRLVDVVLDDCEFSGAVLSEATLVRVEFHQCRMSALVAHGARAQDVRWRDCQLDGANFRGVTVARSAWDGCILHQADFYASKLSGCSFERCDLTDAEFSQAQCDRVDLHGSELHGIRGAGSLRGCVIGTDQVVALALSLFPAIGINIDDEPDR